MFLLSPWWWSASPLARMIISSWSEAGGGGALRVIAPAASRTRPLCCTWTHWITEPSEIMRRDISTATWDAAWAGAGLPPLTSYLELRSWQDGRVETWNEEKTWDNAGTQHDTAATQLIDKQKLDPDPPWRDHKCALVDCEAWEKLKGRFLWYYENALLLLHPSSRNPIKRSGMNHLRDNDDVTMRWVRCHIINEDMFIVNWTWTMTASKAWLKKAWSRFR